MPAQAAAAVDTIVTSDDDVPVRYPGGKGKCFQRLINLMPPHRVYIESHLGGGACMRYKQPAEINIGIDRDESLINVWRREQATSCELVHGDATAFLRTYPFIGDELVYADPPYVPTTRRRARVYRCDFALADHIALLEVLTKLPCRVMVSGYDNDLYSNRLSEWRRVAFSAMTHRGPRLETVWMNYPEPAALHDARFMGETFRQRQSARRRHERLLRRFEGMDGVERQHLLSILRSRFPPQARAVEPSANRGRLQAKNLSGLNQRSNSLDDPARAENSWTSRLGGHSTR